MQEVVNSKRFGDINDPALSVRLLPDVISSNSLTVKSIVVEKQKDLLHQKYAVKRAEYDVGYKSIVSGVNEKLMSLCKIHKDQMCKDNLIIEQHLCELIECASADLILDAWEFITKHVTIMFVKINKFGESLISNEKERLKKIKSHIQEYYVDVHDHCFSDKEKLKQFFEKEISEFNSDALANYQSYTVTIARLKEQLVLQFHSWHNTWEMLLFSWRDHMIKENIHKIEKLSEDREFLEPEELEITRNSCLLTMEHAESSIDEYFDELAKTMPVSLELGVQTFDSIGNIFSQCQDAISKFDSHTTMIFDEKYYTLTEHIGKMRGYLISNSVFEENNSLELFEYSVYSICEEFEKRITDTQQMYIDEIYSKFQSKKEICEEIKGYTFRACNAWGLYLKGYEFAYNDFVHQYDLGLKSSNNNVTWLERSLNKSCGLLVESRTLKQLNKRFDEVKERLDRIFFEYSRYEGSLENSVKSYVEEWVTTEKNLAGDLFTALNLKIDPEQIVTDRSFEFEGKTYVFQGKGSPYSLKFKLKCSESFLAKASVQKELSLQNLQKKLSRLIKQAQNEVQMRKGLHLPRLSVLKKELYEVRLEELNEFGNSCNLFWDEITHEEQKYTNLYRKLGSDTDAVIKKYTDYVAELNIQMTEKETSAELILLQPLINKKAKMYIDELNTLVDDFQREIGVHMAYVFKKHKTLLSISETRSLKMSDEGKIKNEYEEFSELTEDMKVKSESERQKVVHIQEAEDKAMSHYKHTIFSVFFLEKKKEILKECRIRIKTASVSCSKEVVRFENDKKPFKSQKICSSFDENDKVIKEFEGLYALCKSIVNMIDYSSGIGEDLAQCVSMEKLERRYKKFGEGTSRSMDSAILKEILSTSSEKTEGDEIKGPTREEFSWRIQRVKVFRELIGKSLKSVKYGVGVKSESIFISDHNITRSKAATLKRFGLEARGSDNYWASHLLGKKDACKSKDEHDSIVAKACAKLRDRRNSTMNRKSFQASLPLLKDRNAIIKPSKDGSRSTSPFPPILRKQIVQTAPTAPDINKGHSSEQIDMDGAVRLSRTIEFFMGPQRSAQSSVASSMGSSADGRMERFFDFTTTSDETMKEMIFKPAKFFGFKKRCLDVDAISQKIVSIKEKTKYFLRHAFEQFVLSAEVFYRQKNILITKKCIPKDIDSACKDMENSLQLYLSKVDKFCVEGIKKMKKLAFELISYQEQFISSLFASASCYLDSCDKAFIINLEWKFQNIKSQNGERQTALLARLRPCMSHPNYHCEVVELQNSADQLNIRCTEQWTALRAEAFKYLEELHDESLFMVEKYKTSMYSLADVAIHPSKVKRITRAQFKGIEHHQCLQDHMPDENPRKLYQLFMETCDIEKAKQKTKFYDHIGMENARALVHANSCYVMRKSEVSKMFKKELFALQKWMKYWNRNIQELTG